MHICDKCIANKLLASYLLDEHDICSVCGEHQGKKLSENGYRAFANYIIMNFSLIEYYTNGNFSNPRFPRSLLSILTSYETLVYPITNFKNAQYIYNELINQTGINNDDEIRKYFVEDHLKYPLKKCTSRFITGLKKDIYNNNFYKIFDKYQKSVEAYMNLYKPLYSCHNDIFYRARKGCNHEIVEIDDLTTEVSFPFIKNEIEAAPPYLVSEGRFNRKGCSYLYVASDINTAISEVRPEPGEIISIAKFKNTNSNNYLDLRHSIENSQIYDLDTESLHFMFSLVTLFSKPVTHVQKYEYLLTQFLSELFRLNHFRGIVYDSPQNTGFNILSFNPEDFILILNSEEIRLIEKVTYTHSLKKDERYGWDTEPYFNSDEKNEFYGVSYSDKNS